MAEKLLLRIIWGNDTSAYIANTLQREVGEWLDEMLAVIGILTVVPHWVSSGLMTPFLGSPWGGCRTFLCFRLVGDTCPRLSKK